MKNPIVQSLIVVAWAAFLGGFTFLAWTDFALLKAGWCIASDDHCLREWVSATSGWAATIAGSITIYFLYRQNAEQKKQTDFLLGDARPTLDATLDLDDSEQIVVRIVNWNRRGLLIWDVEIAGIADASTGIMELKIDNALIEDEIAFQYLRGWEDRSRGPHFAQYKLAVSVGPELVSEWPPTTKARATVVLFDAQHRQLHLEADIAPINDEVEGW